eukprot:SAG31_NODE_656_length_13120_cov_10.091237_7_plen_108_part_00
MGACSVPLREVVCGRCRFRCNARRGGSTDQNGGGTKPVGNHNHGRIGRCNRNRRRDQHSSESERAPELRVHQFANGASAGFERKDPDSVSIRIYTKSLRGAPMANPY